MQFLRLKHGPEMLGLDSNDAGNKINQQEFIAGNSMTCSLAMEWCCGNLLNRLTRLLHSVY